MSASSTPSPILTGSPGKTIYPQSPVWNIIPRHPEAIWKACAVIFQVVPSGLSPPIGGTIEQDIAGTAQGVWFLPGESTYPEDPHLTLAHDNVDPTQPVFSVGNSVTGLSSGTYTYTLEATGTEDRDFDDINVVGTTYTFIDIVEDTSLVILLKMLTTTSLQIEAQTDADGPPWLFTGNEVEFER